MKGSTAVSRRPGSWSSNKGHPSLPGPSEPPMPQVRGLGGPVAPGSHSPKVPLSPSGHSPEVDVGE